ncbi:phospholipid-transporting ATPase VD isoform X2 [Nelusetta ayraudi]|uniref:phospholipid-transporting ATPase VD isoform X2 n=1 Tax=Nelusetta ayraudi TaxID=303726 RepID=UPI003F7066F1
MRSWEYLSRRPQEEDRSRAWKRKRRKKRTVVSLITLEDEDEELKELLKTYKGNQIRTTKYSLLSFLPRNLFEQLHRFGNVYFIFIAVLNFVPLVQAFQPEVALVPVSLVLAATALKDLWEDYRRFRSDHLVNRLPCWLYFRTQRCYVERRWKDVRVGDFVRLSCNDIIPADMLLLHSSDPRGVCYIETANLDGETNLKQRQVVLDLPFQGAELNLENFHSRIECENPNDDLSRFRGYIEHPSGVHVGLHNNNLLLRSCTIRNTETVVGIVVYAGHETKAMMNNSGPRYKRSHLERRLNTDILWCVLLLVLMCLAAAIGHGLWLRNLKEPLFDTSGYSSPALAGFNVFWTMIIVLQVLIPISLYVSIEFVKLGQIYFIHNDLELYNEQLDSRIQCRAFNITEDLGQIQYLFSDKTGTLTENKMVFCRCSIFGVEYPHVDNALRLQVYEADSSELAARSLTLRSGCSRRSLSCRSLSCNRSSVSLHTLTAETEDEERLCGPDQSQSQNQSQARTSAFCSRVAKEVIPDPALLRKLSCLCSPQLAVPTTGGATESTPSGSPSSLELEYIVDFFLALALCNSVVVSSPVQPQHTAPEAPTPLKAMLQRLSFSPFSSGSPLPPLSRGGGPLSLASRLFSLRKTITFNSAEDSGDLHTSDLKPQFEEQDVDRVGDGEEKEKVKSTSSRGACLDGEDLSKDMNFESEAAAEKEEKVEKKEEQVEDGEKKEKVESRSAGGARWDGEDLSREVNFKSEAAAEEQEEQEEELVYEAESPDEAALVHAAHAYRCTLRGRSAERLLVELPGVGPLAVQLLHVLPFHSTRRRMSVVVRHPLSGRVVVYTKGADSVIMDLSQSPAGSEREGEICRHVREQTEKHLDAYARDGLRTLCIAKKVLEEEEYEVWMKKQLQAESSIENREELLQDSAQRLETQLTLLGTTGIVDRLQEEVPETLQALQQAGIRVWVLTGDKKETALNIANAAKLLRSRDTVLTATGGSKDACAHSLAELLGCMQRQGATEGGAAEESSSSSDCVLVVEGSTLDFALQEELRSDFLELSGRCRVVLCCRSTPLQKSQVVQLLREQLGVMTLAVGDGANDVSMIQVADVGIGISGQEGMQAVMSSDFAISRFKHLRRLLLVHGHWCSSRLANMVLYFIYKNVMYVNLLFWYQFFCGFSGSVMTNSWVLILFNVVFTSVPPLVYGVLDQDLRAETLLKVPELYKTAQNSKVYVPHMFWVTVLDAFYQSLVCFFVPYFALAGSDVDLLSLGSVINTSALFTILLHQVLESHTLTWIHGLVLLLSAASYYGFVVLFSLFCVTCSPPTNPLGVETLQMSRPLFYLISAVATVAALLPRLLYRALSNTFHPTAALRSAQQDAVDVEGYYKRMQRWNLRRSEADRPPVCADNPGLEA